MTSPIERDLRLRDADIYRETWEDREAATKRGGSALASIAQDSIPHPVISAEEEQWLGQLITNTQEDTGEQHD